MTHTDERALYLMTIACLVILALLLLGALGSLALRREPMVGGWRCEASSTVTQSGLGVL
ncbi:MAG: hypothetical protein KA105_00370 [Caulobacter sp.]|nr:hypothetical protein [Caulobacter sp.]